MKWWGVAEVKDVKPISVSEFRGKIACRTKKDSLKYGERAKSPLIQ